MRLYLLRHTKPLIAPGVCYGQTDLAVAEADYVSLAATLRQHWSADMRVYSSPLQRCSLLARQLHTQPCFDPRLMELNFGRWEMCAWNDIPRADIDAWAAAAATYRPGGGEAAVDVARRVISWLQDVQEQGLAEAVVVTHAGVMRMLATWQDGMSAHELAELVCAQNCSFAYAELLEILVFE